MSFREFWRTGRFDQPLAHPVYDRGHQHSTPSAQQPYRPPLPYSLSDASQQFNGRVPSQPAEGADGPAVILPPNHPTSLWAPLPTQTSTRLLVLHPGPDYSQIHAHLQTIDLRDGYGYQAVSYTWGKEVYHRKIVINGNHVSVRSNLVSFLLRARHPEFYRFLWIDAFCISQDNLAEKAGQVRIIANIFSYASNVIAWVGEHADDSEHFFSYKLLKDATMSPRFMRAAERFWSRPYWNRTWIPQEIAVAQRLAVHCGDIAIRWEQLLFRVRLTRDHAVGARIHSLIQARRTSNAPYNIFNAVRTFQTTRCEDARDHVYALLSLAKSKPDETEFPADYTIDILQMLKNLMLARAHYINTGFPLREFFTQLRILHDVQLHELLTWTQENINHDVDGKAGWRRFQYYAKHGKDFVPILTQNSTKEYQYYWDQDKEDLVYINMTDWIAGWKPPLKDRVKNGLKYHIGLS